MGRRVRRCMSGGDVGRREKVWEGVRRREKALDGVRRREKA